MDFTVSGATWDATSRTITITGTNFTSGGVTLVRLDGSTGPIDSRDQTTITIKLPGPLRDGSYTIEVVREASPEASPEVPPLSLSTTLKIGSTATDAPVIASADLDAIAHRLTLTGTGFTSAVGILNRDGSTSPPLSTTATRAVFPLQFPLSSLTGGTSTARLIHDLASYPSSDNTSFTLTLPDFRIHLTDVAYDAETRVVTVTGTGFNDRNVTTGGFRLDGTTESSPATVVSGTTATFVVPQALPAGQTVTFSLLAQDLPGSGQLVGDSTTYLVPDTPQPDPNPDPAAPLPARAWDLMLSLQDGRDWPGGTVTVSVLQEWASSNGLRIGDVRLVPGQTVQYAPDAHTDPTTGGINDPVWTGPAPTDDGVLSLPDPASWSWSADENFLGAQSPAGRVTVQFPTASLDGPWELEDDQSGRFCPRPVTIIKTIFDVDVVDTDVPGPDGAYLPRGYRVPVSERVTGTPVPADDGCAAVAADDIVELAPGESLDVPVLENDSYAGEPLVELDQSVKLPAGLSATVLSSGKVAVTPDSSLTGQIVEVPYDFFDVGGFWNEAGATLRLKVTAPSTPTPEPEPEPEPPTPTPPTPEPPKVKGPTARPDRASATYDEPVTINVARNDTFTGEYAIEVLRGTVPHGVKAKQVGNGRIVVIVPERLAGKTFSFRYEIEDETGQSDTAQITVKVAEVPVIIGGADFPMPTTTATPAIVQAAPTASEVSQLGWFGGVAGLLAVMVLLALLRERWLRGRRSA
ncbi:Ig-like domain-containing protein [Nocardioides pinisoli]|uniref:IPT/TIG domain-containing protein n=1 Tax=Nocardioides pinisoli TaxID=2950279 RepID=A0ABT1KRH4_9ACTN|nr:IPT/TIG domain-containing protein [Nocardioides pinisoli]MCP3420325.1 IPT/TIG domain-containing protein [Nocardioides pinisoli]